MKAFWIALLSVTLVGCGGSGGGDDGTEYTAPPSYEPGSPPVAEQEPEVRDLSDLCIVIQWELPTARTDDRYLPPGEIANILVIREPTPSDDPDARQKMLDRGTLADRIIEGDPLIHYVAWGSIEADCDDIGMARGDFDYWYGVAVIDYEGSSSDVSDLIHPHIELEL